MLLNLLIVAVVLVAILLVIVSLQPSTFRVQRSITVDAPAALVFDQVNDFHKMEAWSPWLKLDPGAKSTFAGAPAGKGAIYSWVGNSKVGEGRLTITESRPGESVRYHQEFFKPFKGTNTAEFTLTPEGNQTRLTWLMYGENGFMSKAIGLFLSMDKMLGGNFEQGLASIKTLAEAEARRT